jgi:hypothetical protein
MTHTNSCNTFVSLAVLTASTPPSQGSIPAMRYLAAIAMLVAERDEAGGWRLDLQHRAIGAGTSEDVLLRWATEALPEQGIVIGWQLADGVVAPLLGAAREGDPELATAFLARLTALVTAPSVDLALAHGGAAAPPLASILSSRGIAASLATLAEIESAWAFGHIRWLCRQAESEAIAAWRLWLAEANGIAKVPAAAFERWLGQRG